MKRQITLTLLPIGLVIFFLTFGHMAIAAPGDLDPTFGNSGKVIDGVSHAGNANAQAVAIQQDGKIVAAGNHHNAGNFDFALVRYNPDGSLDGTFDSDGRVTTPIGAGDDALNAVGIQQDGKIVAAGYSNNGGNQDFALVRYNPDGSLDTTFDFDGKVTTSIGTSHEGAFAVAIQPDGKIVAAGYSNNGSNVYFALFRYNTNGSLDDSFHSDGKVTTLIGIGAFAFAVAILPDGKIVAAGDSQSVADPNTDFALVRYNPNGSLDTSFDGDGKVTTPSGTARAVTIQADGKILAAGSMCVEFDGFGNCRTGALALLRYNTNGSLDTALDSDGKVTTSIGVSASASGVALQQDGKIVVADGRTALVRYNPDGSIDTTFGGGDGIVDLQIYVSSAVLQPDGKIVAAGAGNAAARYQVNRGEFGLVRLTSDSSLDMTFDSDGIVTTGIGVLSDNGLRSVTIQPDRKVVATGWTYGYLGVVVRYNADGSRDTTFGDSGIASVNFDAYSTAVQPDGKIVVGGGSESCNKKGCYYYIALTRLNPDGSADPTFAFSGIGDAYAFSVHVQPDGKIIAAGGNQVIRLNGDDSFDTTFGGGDGIAELPITVILDSVIQPDGKIVLGGNGIARCNPDGTLDTSFGNGGVVTGSGYSSVALQADGKIIAAASNQLTRLNPNGSLDTGFGGETVTMPISVNEVAVQSDGKIAAAGSSKNDFALVRYSPNGSLDTTFGGGDGIKTVDFHHSSDHAYGMALDSQGRAVLVGASDGAFALARFLLTPRSAPFDFDGDGKTDTSVFRPSEGNWYLNRSTEGMNVVSWGLNGDKIVPGDYDGDAKTDTAVFRESNGNWYVVNSATNTFDIRQWGLAGDIPLPGDHDGDGGIDRGVFRPSESKWYVQHSNGTIDVTQFGSTGDIPVPADFDGDGDTELATFQNGQWQIVRNGGSTSFANWGLPGDVAVPADYDGDSKTDLAVFRPSNGRWYIINSSNQHITESAWGLTGDIPVPGDYDGDGRSDLAVYRNGAWYLLQTTSGISVRNWGLAADRPVPAAYLSQN